MTPKVWGLVRTSQPFADSFPFVRVETEAKCRHTEAPSLPVRAGPRPPDFKPPLSGFDQIQIQERGNEPLCAPEMAYFGRDENYKAETHGYQLRWPPLTFRPPTKSSGDLHTAGEELCGWQRGPSSCPFPFDLVSPSSSKRRVDSGISPTFKAQLCCLWMLPSSCQLLLSLYRQNFTKLIAVTEQKWK